MTQSTLDPQTWLDLGATPVSAKWISGGPVLVAESASAPAATAPASPLTSLLPAKLFTAPGLHAWARAGSGPGPAVVDYVPLNGETDVASAATLVLTGVKTRRINITGTTGITAITMAPNSELLVKFAAALTITQNGTSLITQGAANVLTDAGATCTLVSDASGNVRVRNFVPGGFSPIFRQGTATPSFTVGTTAATGYGTRRTNWARFGNMVMFELYLEVTAWSSTGSLFVPTSLPYLPTAATWVNTAAHIEGFTGVVNHVGAQLSAGGSLILYAGSATSETVSLTHAALGGQSVKYGASGLYLTSAA